jgi:hypothetical protein
MAAPPKLTARREKRLLRLLGCGESFEASCRAINVSSTAVRKRASRDPAFAERLRAARERNPTIRFGEDPLDWREGAAQLERSDPLRWSLPDGSGDPFDFDPPA